MKSIPLAHVGAAIMNVSMASLNGRDMPTRQFIVDTGATRTTIRKNYLTRALDYSEEYIQKNKLILPENEKPMMANGTRADVYMVKAPRLNIGGHEFQPDYILTSDTIHTLTFLLGLDLLSYFKFTFDFDAIDENAKYGRMFFEFRDSRVKLYTELGKPFAYTLNL
ncbi:MAG: retroviral-like aspartic protease family protein [Oscillospiraceae bacterium]|jgi:hypothetical protein|nr:retroviral-like aspartic protease family protein [Oscillospiraceae bacterium]